MERYNRVYAVIHLDCIADNMRAMAAGLCPGTSMIGVVKTDGYGHGAVPVARTISPFVCGFAVATVEEAVILRNHGIDKPVLVLGVVHKSQYEQLFLHQIRPTVFQFEKAELLSRMGEERGQVLPVHLALDTGMSRIGMSCDPVSADMAARIAALPGIRVEGLFTHFAKADEADKSSAHRQLERYLDFVGMLRERGLEIPVCHCSNSAGILDLKRAHLDAVRAGISIYGLYPSGQVDRGNVILKPAMELKSRITYVKDIDAGTEVSYGGTFVASHPMRIATIPVGYGDGYPRGLSNRGYVLIDGRRAPVLGRVCMDQMMVDVSEIPGAAEDSMVTLLGRDGELQITMEDLADLSGGFHYEIPCVLGKRVPRLYMDGERVIGSKDYFEDVYGDFNA